jgi:hypothetical protein
MLHGIANSNGVVNMPCIKNGNASTLHSVISDLSVDLVVAPQDDITQTPDLYSGKFYIVGIRSVDGAGNKSTFLSGAIQC